MPLPPALARLAALVASAAFAVGCATPVAPTGGPADTTPPSLVGSDPADGSTNVAGRRVTLTFSERLAPTARAAVQVVPEADAPPEVRVRGRELEVLLPPLRDSTTYVLTVGTELQDQRNVALRTPITLAFATGNAIDRGRIDGVVRDPRTGAGAAGLNVWAYPLADTSQAPDVRTTAPAYRTQSADDGAFRLDYLRPGRYVVVAVDDRNRNGRVDAGERFGAPPTLATSTSNADDSTATAPRVPFWVTTLDSLPPEPQRVRTASDRRLSVRFSEPVRLAGVEAEAWALADSASGAAAPVRLYQPADAPFEVFLVTDRPLPPTRHVVSYAGTALADSSGNAVAPFSLAFTPPERPDTLSARFVGFLPAARVAPDSAQTLEPGVRPGVRFTAPPDDLAERLTVTASGQPLALPLVTTDGVSYRVPLDTLPGALALTVRVADSTRTRRYETLAEDQTGGIVGTVTGADTTAVVQILPPTGEPRLVRVGTDGTFVVGGLAEGSYRLRVFVDRNGNGRWDGGTLVPYAPPEPLRILPEAVGVRARWETEIEPVSFDAPPDS